jgi:hypothetical protein
VTSISTALLFFTFLRSLDVDFYPCLAATERLSYLGGVTTRRVTPKLPGMAKAKESELALAVEDVDSDGGIFNRRRHEEDNEQSPLLRSSHDDEQFRAGATSGLLDSLPWYKRPSVCSYIFLTVVNRLVLITLIGFLAFGTVRLLSFGFRRRDCSQGQSCA